MKAVTLAGLASLCAPLYSQVNATNLGGGSMPGATWQLSPGQVIMGNKSLNIARNWSSTGWVPYPWRLNTVFGPSCMPSAGQAETLCLSFFGNPAPPIPLASGCAWWHAPVGALGYTNPILLGNQFVLCQGAGVSSLGVNRIIYPPAVSGYTIHFQTASMVGDVQVSSSSGSGFGNYWITYSQHIVANNLSTPHTCEVVPGLNLVISDGYSIVLP